MIRIKNYLKPDHFFFRKDHPPKAVAEEVPDTELPEETMRPTYGRSGKHKASLSLNIPFPSFLAPLPFDQDLLIIGLGFSPLTGAISSISVKTTNVKDLQNALEGDDHYP